MKRQAKPWECLCSDLTSNGLHGHLSACGRAIWPHTNFNAPAWALRQALGMAGRVCCWPAARLVGGEPQLVDAAEGVVEVLCQLHPQHLRAHTLNR